MLKNNKNYVIMNEGYYICTRDDDGKGDSGPMLISIDPVTNEAVGKNGEIRIGCLVKCGSMLARSYTAQDWWLTSKVIQILKVNKDRTEVKFRTLNSTYTVRSL